MLTFDWIFFLQQNKEAITRILQEAHYQTLDESELLSSIKKEKIIDEDFELLEANITACSKFTLSLTGPDFTAYKIDDPFKRLGPIAIFSARRHWTAPRSVRLQKGTNYDTKRSTRNGTNNGVICHCKKSTYDANCEVCLKYTTYSGDESLTTTNNVIAKEDAAESFGFHVRGNAPVIIPHVELNSLADVSLNREEPNWDEFCYKNNRIFYILVGWYERR